MLGKIIVEESTNTIKTQGKFFIDFSNSKIGPYTHLYDREKLYYHEIIDERGSLDFPLKNAEFENSEIFLETDDIAICIWERWSISWGISQFIDIINLSNGNKNRFFTDEVNLIYNTETTVEINLVEKWKTITHSLDINSLEITSSIEENLVAFFKLIWNKTTGKYENLVFDSESNDAKKWFFKREKIEMLWFEISPERFDRKSFIINTKWKSQILVWDSTLYNTLITS